MEKCRRVLKDGATVQKCLCNEYDRICEFQCKKKKCFQVCKDKEVEVMEADICVKRHLRICQKRCIKDPEDCQKECKWRKMKLCYQDRLPGKHAEDCSFIF